MPHYTTWQISRKFDTVWWAILGAEVLEKTGYLPDNIEDCVDILACLEDEGRAAA